MKYIRKSTRKDLILLKLKQYLFRLPFTLIGTLIIIYCFDKLSYFQILLTFITGIIFLLIGLFALVMILLSIFKIIVLKDDQYYTLFYKDNNKEQFLEVCRGNSVGLPDKYDDLTFEENKLLDEKIYVLGQNTNDYMGVNHYKYESKQNIENVKNNVVIYNNESKYIEEEIDPFDDFYKK